MSPAAQTVLRLAQIAAVALEHPHLGTEHILLGLLQEGRSQSVQILSRQTDLDAVSGRVRKVAGRGHVPPEEELTLTPRAAQVVQLARREAMLHSDSEIEPDHLFIGILREGDGTAAQLMLALGIDFGMVRAEVARAMGHD